MTAWQLTFNSVPCSVLKPSSCINSVNPLNTSKKCILLLTPFSRWEKLKDLEFRLTGKTMEHMRSHVALNPMLTLLPPPLKESRDFRKRNKTCFDSHLMCWCSLRKDPLSWKQRTSSWFHSWNFLQEVKQPSHTCVLRRVINTTTLWYTLIAVRALSSYGTWAPEHAGSVAGARAQLPHCCETLVPQPGIKPECPASEGGFLTTGAPGSSHNCRFLDSTKLPKGLLCDLVILGYSHLSFQEAPTLTCALIPR